MGSFLFRQAAEDHQSDEDVHQIDKNQDVSQDTQQHDLDSQDDSQEGQLIDNAQWSNNSQDDSQEDYGQQDEIQADLTEQQESIGDHCYSYLNEVAPHYSNMNDLGDHCVIYPRSDTKQAIQQISGDRLISAYTTKYSVEQMICNITAIANAKHTDVNCPADLSMLNYLEDHCYSYLNEVAPHHSNTNDPEESHDIDLVMLYVDSTDSPQWISKFQEAKQHFFNSLIHNKDSITLTRFTPAGDSLKFALRSLSQNMKFLRSIILVLDDDTQIPNWMNLHQNSLRIVRFSEFIPNELLPTFNSNMIEAYLCRIPNLSEIFIYSTQSVLCMNEVIIDHFIDEYKSTAIFLDKSYAPEGNPIVSEYASRSQYKNINNWLNNHFNYHGSTFGLPLYDLKKMSQMQVGDRRSIHANQQTRQTIAIQPQALSKSILQELITLMQSELQPTLTHKFKSIHDYSLINGMFQYYTLYTNRAFISHLLTNKTIYVNDHTDLETLLNSYTSTNQVDFFSIQHTFKFPDEQKHTIIRNFLHTLFPDKSPYEL